MIYKREDIVILPPDNPDHKRLAWTFYEIPFGKSKDEYLKETMSAEDYDAWIECEKSGKGALDIIPDNGEFWDEY